MNASKSKPIRYAVITEKNPREIIMLRGSGCKWKKCRFCDYHLDSSPDKAANYALNKEVLKHITGLYKRLEVINSGSFCELDEDTVSLIETVCLQKDIQDIHFESHWIYREAAGKIKERFQNKQIRVHIKTGVETFDIPFRENILCKGFQEAEPEEIASFFDEVCLLQGLSGQTASSMIKDIETGLSFFERVCVNIMVENTMPLKPDKTVIQSFKEQVYPRYISNKRVDILLENTDFGVGGEIHAVE